MRTASALPAAMAIVAAMILAPAHAEENQDGPAETIGRRIDRGLGELAEELRHAWAEARQTVDQLSVRGRVYGRLRWDKTLADHPIEIAVQKNDTVVLTGKLPDQESRQKAVRLAEDTVGVRNVVDRLEIVPPVSPRDAATTVAPDDGGQPSEPQ